MELKERLNFRQLLEKPITFSFQNSINFGDELLLEDDTDEAPETQTTPWMHSFDELKRTMVQIPNKGIFKRVINNGNGEVLGLRKCCIKWSYSVFFENEKSSYDSSFMGKTNVKSMMYDDILPGIWNALETMRKGERAHFIIDHSLMYGKYGIVAGRVQVKPNADVLLDATLVDFYETGSEKACDELSADELRQFHLVNDKLFYNLLNMSNIQYCFISFSQVKDKAIEMQLKAIDFKRKHLYSHAIRVNLEVIQRLLLCDTANEDESNAKNKLLSDVYAHLIGCYIKIEDYKKAHSTVNDLREIYDVDHNAQVLMNEAIALSKIDDNYDQSIGLLRKAQKLDPHNSEVNAVLDEMLKARKKYEKDTKNFFQRAFQTKAQPKSKGQEESLAEIIKSIGNIDIGADVPLIGYPEQELQKIQKAIKDDPAYDLKVTRDSTGQLVYSIKKIS